MFMQTINDPDTEASVCARQKLKAAEVRFHAAVFIASLHAADSAGIRLRTLQTILLRIMQPVVVKAKKLQKQLATPGSSPYNTELLRIEGSDANEDR